MKFDRTKFQALVLYVIWRAGDYAGFGSTKLNKVLWFSEARAFQALGKPITGETYIRQKFGPVPEHVDEICAALEQDNVIQIWSEPYFEFPIKRYKTHQPPDISLFSIEELGMIDWWVKHVAEQHTAKSISGFSHDYAWQIAGMGETLPISAFLARNVRPSREGEELDWARTEAQRLGLK